MSKPRLFPPPSPPPPPKLKAAQAQRLFYELQIPPPLTGHRLSFGFLASSATRFAANRQDGLLGYLVSFSPRPSDLLCRESGGGEEAESWPPANARAARRVESGDVEEELTVCPAQSHRQPGGCRHHDPGRHLAVHRGQVLVRVIPWHSMYTSRLPTAAADLAPFTANPSSSAATSLSSVSVCFSSPQPLDVDLSRRTLLTRRCHTPATGLLEFQIPPLVSRYASFLFSFIGRGICTNPLPPPNRQPRSCTLYPPPPPPQRGRRAWMTQPSLYTDEKPVALEQSTSSSAASCWTTASCASSPAPSSA